MPLIEKTGIGIDKATQFPETRNQSTQTIDRPEKGVDTFDDLNPMSGEYILQTDEKEFGKNDKMVQATSVRVNQNDSSPPDSGDSNMTKASYPKMLEKVSGWQSLL